MSGNHSYVSIGRPVEDDGSGTVRFVDELGANGEPISDTNPADGVADAIEWHRIDGSIDISNETVGGQAFIGIDNKAGKGVNHRFSIDVKGGLDGQLGATGEGDGAFLMFRTQDGTAKVSGHRYELYVKLDSAGNLYVNKSPVIGTISKDKYTNLTIDFVCNTGSAAAALVYVDGVHVYTQPLAISITAESGYALSDYHSTFVRIYSLYGGPTKSLKDRDIRIGSMSYVSISDYDVAPERISVFQNDLDGMFGIGGIVRYYDGNGGFATEDFEYGGEKYSVGFGGSVIGKTSDGHLFAPYAPYVNWPHTGTFRKQSVGGRFLSGKDESGVSYGGVAVNLSRDATEIAAVMQDGSAATLYTSFYDSEPESSPNDHTSYASIPLDNLQNKDVVLDLGIMLSGNEVRDYFSNNKFFYLDGTGTDGNRQEANYNIDMTGDGWLYIPGGNDVIKQRLVKINKTEFTRLSFVIHGPKVSGSSITERARVDIYANGILIVEDLAGGNANQAKLSYIRVLKMRDTDFSVYVKNMYLYESSKPQQFVGMVDGVPILTSNQNAAPARPADMKQGFVEENGVVRYYNESGYPILSGSFTDGGKVYNVGMNGVLSCDGKNHLKVSDKGYCIGCGKTMDGVSSLYGTSLVLKSNVKVVFYLDIDAANAKAVEIGLARDYANTSVKTALADLKRVTIGEKTYYEVGYEVTAKDICSDVTVRAVKNDDTTGTEFTTSAAKYAEGVQEKPTDTTYTAELKALANALLVYGRNAAAVLADGEAAEEITEAIDWSTVTIPTDGYKDLALVVGLEKITLDLKSNIKIRVYFTFNDANTDALTYNYSVKVNGDAAEYIDLGEGRYCIEKEITASQLDDVFTFEVLNIFGGTGLRLHISALYYAKVMVGSSETGYENLMKAIKLYSDAANAYVNEIAEENRPAV